MAAALQIVACETPIASVGTGAEQEVLHGVSDARRCGRDLMAAWQDPGRL